MVISDEHLQQLTAMQTNCRPPERCAKMGIGMCRSDGSAVQQGSREAGDDATAVMSWLQSFGDEKHKCDEKRQIRSHRREVERREANRSKHSRWNCRNPLCHCTAT